MKPSVIIQVYKQIVRASGWHAALQCTGHVFANIWLLV